jgi:hypothetical protein
MRKVLALSITALAISACNDAINSTPIDSASLDNTINEEILPSDQTGIKGIFTDAELKTDNLTVDVNNSNYLQLFDDFESFKSEHNNLLDELNYNSWETTELDEGYELYQRFYSCSISGDYVKQTTSDQNGNDFLYYRKTNDCNISTGSFNSQYYHHRIDGNSEAHVSFNGVNAVSYLFNQINNGSPYQATLTTNLNGKILLKSDDPIGTGYNIRSGLNSEIDALSILGIEGSYATKTTMYDYPNPNRPCELGDFVEYDVNGDKNLITLETDEHCLETNVEFRNRWENKEDTLVYEFVIPSSQSIDLIIGLADNESQYKAKFLDQGNYLFLPFYKDMTQPNYQTSGMYLPEGTYQLHIENIVLSDSDAEFLLQVLGNDIEVKFLGVKD